MRTIILLLLFPGLLSAQKSSDKKKIILPDGLPEVSGFAYQSADSLWWLNDSGNGAVLFRTNRNGELQEEVALPYTANRDWEGLAQDDSGHLYIGDFGNNRNQRTDLCIYRWKVGTTSVDSITYTYPDQHEYPPSPEGSSFNMEGFIWYQDSLHLFSKDHAGRGTKHTKHYVLPAEPGHHIAQLRDSLAMKKRIVTGAAIDRSSGQLVLLTYNFRLFLKIFPFTPTDAYVFEPTEDSNFLGNNPKRQKVARRLRPTQFEAIDFVAPWQLLTASEKTPLFRQQARVLRIKY